MTKRASGRRALVAPVVPGRDPGIVSLDRRAAPEVDVRDPGHRRGELLRRPDLDVAGAAHRQRRPLARQVLAEVGATAGDAHLERLGRARDLRAADAGDADLELVSLDLVE